MLIIFLTGDLVFPSRVAGIAQRLGAPIEVAPTAEALLAKLAAHPSEPTIVLIDLSSPHADPAELVPRLKQLAHPPRATIAFGPHVHDAKLAAAEAAGCELVLTRGQFSAQFDTILTQLASSDSAKST